MQAIFGSENVSFPSFNVTVTGSDTLLTLTVLFRRDARLTHFLVFPFDFFFIVSFAPRLS